MFRYLEGKVIDESRHGGLAVQDDRLREECRKEDVVQCQPVVEII